MRYCCRYIDMLREGLDALGRAIEVVVTSHAAASV
jgi:hypothetical protein